MIILKFLRCILSFMPGQLWKTIKYIVSLIGAKKVLMYTMSANLSCYHLNNGALSASGMFIYLFEIWYFSNSGLNRPLNLLHIDCVSLYIYWLLGYHMAAETCWVKWKRTWSLCCRNLCYNGMLAMSFDKTCNLFFL